MRPYLLTLTVVALFVLAGCVSPLQAATGVAADSDNSTIVASGVGTASADPDLAVISVAVNSFSRSADSARAMTAERVNDLLAALDEAGVADDAVTTTSYSLTPQYDYRDGTTRTIGYRAVHSMQIEVAPDDAGRIVDVSVGAADVEVWSVSFTLTDERRNELRTEAIAAAVNFAKNDADAAATAAGLTVVGVESINIGSQPSYGPYPYYAEARAEDSSTTFNPGPVTVSATVTVTYRTE